MTQEMFSSYQSRLGQDERVETHFLTDLLRAIGADQERPNFEFILKRLKKQQNFAKKVQRIVSDVEGRKVESHKECIKWIKGLLIDFMTLHEKL